MNILKSSVGISEVKD